MSVKNVLDRMGANGLSESLAAAMCQYDITPTLRAAHFIAQIAHESAGFRRTVENLNYSAKGLLSTWPSRFDAASALAYERDPQRIANKVYAGRFGNGDEASGDGWRFRGRGLIQLTFRDNYRTASQAVFGDERLLDTPENAAAPQAMSKIAAWWWSSHRLNELADAGDIVGVTRTINGGLNGLEDRRQWLGKALAAFDEEMQT